MILLPSFFSPTIFLQRYKIYTIYTALYFFPAEKIPYISYIFYTFADYRRVNN